MNKIRESLDKVMMGYIPYTKDFKTNERHVIKPRGTNIPTGIALAITVIDGANTQLFEELSKVVSSFRQEGLCDLSIDKLNIQSFYSYKGDLQTEDLYEERLRRYNTVIEGFGKLSLLEKEGFKFGDIQQPSVEYSSNWEMSEKNTCNDCYIRVVADFRSNFYREFYLKGLLDACRNNARSWVLQAYTTTDSFKFGTTVVSECRIITSKITVGGATYILSDANGASEESLNTKTG